MNDTIDSGGTWWKIPLILFGIWIIGAIMLPSTSPNKRSYLAACISNEKQICCAMIMYANDHNDKLPSLKTTAQQAPYGQSWQELLMPYIKSPKVFRCSKQPDRMAYSFNRRLSGIKLGKVTYHEHKATAADVILAFESINDSPENNNLNGDPTWKPFSSELPRVGSWPVGYKKDWPKWARPRHYISRSEGSNAFYPVVWADGHVTCPPR